MRPGEGWRTQCQIPAVRRGPRCPGSRHPSTPLKPLESGTEQGQVPSGLPRGSPGIETQQRTRGARRRLCVPQWGRGAGHGAEELGPSQMSHSLE